MSKLDVFLLALKNFRRRMTRSILTIVGVVIGSMAIVVMVSLGIGIQENMMTMIERWGDLTTIQVPAWNIGNEGGGGGGRGDVVVIGGGGGGGTARTSSRRASNQPNPFYEARDEIERLEHVVAAMLFRRDSVRMVSGRYVNPWAQIALVDVSRLHYFNFNVSQGRLLEPGDGDYAIVLSIHDAVNFVNLRQREWWRWDNRPMDPETNMPIPNVDIFNDEIRLTFDERYGERPLPGEARRRPQLHELEIVGFQEEWGMFAWESFMDAEAFNRNRRAYINSIIRTMPPEEASMFDWVLERLDRYDMIYVKVDHRDNVVSVVESLRELGHEAWNNMEHIENINAQMVLIQLVMGAIGAVALLVAAINIANTMIMSIYERTKEIGIMKVLGCRLGDILLLFLLEAVIIGLIGGIIGIGASFGASTLLNNLPPETISSIFGFHVDPTIGASLSVIPFWLILLSLGISVGVAVLAGLYPSIRAMRLSALEAIRNE